MQTESTTIPSDPKTARQIRKYLAQRERQRKRWVKSQQTDRRNRIWKRALVAASYTKAIRNIGESGGSLRPADGTFFYPPSLGAHEQRIRRIEHAILEHVAGRAEPPGKGTGLVDYAAEAVSSMAATHLKDLELLASQGDEKSLEAYAQIARTMVGNLNRFPKPMKRRLRRFASRCQNWPVLMGRGSLYTDEIKSILNELAVGTRLPFSSEAIRLLKRRPRKRVLKLALELACRLENWRTRDPHAIVFYLAFSPPTRAEHNAPQLKPFSKATWPAWFGLAWEIVLEENNDHPEANPELRPLGLYREKHSLLQEQQKNATHKTRESNIKDGIKEKLKQAFEQRAKQAG